MVGDDDEDALRLSSFAGDLRLDAAAFAKRHAPGVFVHLGRGRLQTPSGPLKTVAIESRRSADDAPFSESRVWAIRKSDRSVIASFISVGRTRTNDVVIADVSLSKFHAFLSVEPSGLFLQDARSRNGTFVNNTRIHAQGEGPPTPLITGARVRFGAAELTYLDAFAFRRLLSSLAERPR